MLTNFEIHMGMLMIGEKFLLSGTSGDKKVVVTYNKIIVLIVTHSITKFDIFRNDLVQIRSAA